MAVGSGRSVFEMPLEKKIGRMIWCPMRGGSNWGKGARTKRCARLLREGYVGGIVVKEGDLYETATLIRQLQKDREQPLVVAADVENGLGSLLKEGTRFPSNMAFGATRSGEYGFLAGKIIAEEACAVGINVLFGPTCIRSGSGLPEGLPVTRCYGEKLHLVTRLALAFVQGVHEGGALAVPRFFPGTPAVHSGELTGNRWLHYLRQLLVDTELSIYDILSQSGLSALMADWREMPDLLTGRSMRVFTNRHLLEVFLREVMDYRGVVISPELNTPAAREMLDEEMLMSAVNAGVDVLAGVEDPEWAIDTLVRAVHEEKVALSRIDQALRRISRLTGKLNRTACKSITPDEIDRKVASRANLEVADRLAEDAITVLRDSRRLLPLDPGQKRTLVSLSVTACKQDGLDRPLAQTLRKEYDRVVSLTIDSEATPSKLEQAWEETRNAGRILCCLFNNQPPRFSMHDFSPTQVEFVRRLIAGDVPVIMAAFGDPLTISLFPEVECYICLYSDTPASQRALVRELFGELVMPVKGKLPVTLDSNFPYGYGLDLNH